MGSSSFEHCLFKKENKKNKKKVQHTGATKPNQRKKSKIDKSHEEYFFFKKLGH